MYKALAVSSLTSTVPVRVKADVCCIHAQYYFMIVCEAAL